MTTEQKTLFSININNVVKDDDIYPRPRISQQTIENYTEAVKAGASFPPITVQPIKIGSNGTSKIVNIILDGYHRYEAYKKADQLAELPVSIWKNEVLDRELYFEDLITISIQLNRKHGDRIENKDLVGPCRKIVQYRSLNKLVGLVKELADRFNVTEGYMSQLIGDDIAKRKMSRDALAYRLSLLGWTQREIAEVVGVTQQAVAELTKNFNTKLFCQEYQAGMKPERIADSHNLDQALLWAILLDGKKDIDRFKLFNSPDCDQPKMSDHWYFTIGDHRLGIQDYPGRLFGQQVMNILYYFSKQDDLVVDPMVGGGTTIDTCLVMNRKCRGYDILPENSSRNDVEKYDSANKDGLPDKAQNCDLILFDPPYYKKEEEAYGCQQFTKDKKTFLNYIETVGLNCYKALKQSKYMAVINSQYLDFENEDNNILNSHLANIFQKNGFKHILNIQTPLSFDTQWRATAIENAKKQEPWRILPISRDWMIFKK